MVEAGAASIVTGLTLIFFGLHIRVAVDLIHVVDQPRHKPVQ
ncbi:hypothetical protein ACFSCW_03475 [Sphingomonas tabacisoli]|uniref:Uncharacterized protein n=1 Tax=Sphingomonas tabacisoli TaxID=2249466 RepID=A0ABW4HYW5_9SPHN